MYCYIEALHVCIWSISKEYLYSDLCEALRNSQSKPRVEFEKSVQNKITNHLVQLTADPTVSV